MVLSVAVLGPPVVTVDGTPLEVDTRKAVALLALLAVDGPQPRARAADLLWTASDHEHARNALRRTLSVLNRALGCDAVVSSEGRLALPPVTATDVARHRELLAATRAHDHAQDETCGDCIGPLREVVGLHRGPLLDGLRLRGAEGFDDWVEVAGERGRRELCVALERLSRAEVEHDDLPSAEAHVARWVALDPLVEEAWVRLALLQAWAGRHDDAERTLQRCARTLHRELGVAPDDATTRWLRCVVTRTVPPADAVDVPVPPRR